jgi:hypothetical protein
MSKGKSSPDIVATGPDSPGSSVVLFLPGDLLAHARMTADPEKWIDNGLSVENQGALRLARKRVALPLGTIDTGSPIATNAIFGGEYGRRRDMAITFLKDLDVASLSKSQKEKLKESLLKHKRSLNRTSKIIDGHLETLAGKKKKKSKAKR